MMGLEPGQGLGQLGSQGSQGAKFLHLSTCPLFGPQYSELQDKVTSAETKVLEMETTVEDLQWDIEKLRKREQKLNKHVAEALEQVGSGAVHGRARAGHRAGPSPPRSPVSPLHSSTLATTCLGAHRASRGARSHSACRRSALPPIPFLCP